ncbi:MAG: hypothetical protein ACREOG_05775 [Gemmatimonadaceae bacterium]
MNAPAALYHRVDRRLTRFMADHGITLLRISLGVVFLWFGALKFFPGVSPATDLAVRTIRVMTGGALSDAAAIYVLATWECLIGIGLILGRLLRTTLLLLWLQMAGTLTPLFFFPDEVFRVIPFAPTLEGQYIIKNVVLISAAIVIGATVRGGKVIADPRAAARAKRAES